jgi:hypothetical protein
MWNVSLQMNSATHGALPGAFFLVLTLCATNLLAQQSPAPTTVQLPDAPTASVLSGTVTDTDEATISGAHIALENTETKATHNTQSDATGAFFFGSVPPGRYVVKISAPGFGPGRLKTSSFVPEKALFFLPSSWVLNPSNPPSTRSRSKILPNSRSARK